jgi:hypothetical protein
LPHLTAIGSAAAAAWLFSGQPAKYYCCGATCVRVNLESGYRAVSGASPAFHATVFIGNYGFAVFNNKNTMWAYFRAFSAPYTFFL